MALAVASVMAIAIAGAFWLVWVNRASSEVVGAAIPVAIAAFSALALVFAFGNPPPIEKNFGVVFVMDRETKHPIVIPHRPFSAHSLGMFSEAVKRDPDLLKDPRIDSFNGGPLLHHFLQKMMLDWISTTHATSWRSRVERYEAGGSFQLFTRSADAPAFAVKTLSAEDIRRLLTGNLFAHVAAFGPGSISTPPGTTVAVKVPYHDEQLGDVSLLRFQNGFVDFEVRTNSSAAFVGLGSYQLLSDIPLEDAQKRFVTSMFIVRMSASFNRFRKGNPDMEAHREWITGIVDGLSREFDEEVVFKKTTETYLLWQHAAGVKPELPLGPISIR